MKLILVRHGETEENVNEIIQGHIPGKLTKRGHAQVKKLALRLRKLNIDVIISSDLNRARETAKEIAKFHETPIIFSKLVREKHYGIYEGSHVSKYKQAKKQHPDWKPEGGESFAELRERVEGFFNSIFPKYRGKTVLVVSHGGFNRQLLGYLLKKDIDESRLIPQNNTCVNILAIKDDGNHEAKLINSTEHL